MPKLTLRRICLVALLVVSCSIATFPAAAAPAHHLAGRVVGVHDGDTLTVLVGRQQVKVRLEGIDCPELAQPYGRVAKLFTSDRAFGRAAEVVTTTNDRYGRVVGHVYVGGEDLGAALLSAGLAWHYTEYSSDRSMDALEMAARAAHRGLWSQSDPMPPWVYRRGTRSSQPAFPRNHGRVSRPPALSSGPFHGNTVSHVFHAPGCAKYNCRNCTAIFASREQAQAAGYKPAGDCRNK